MLKILIAVIFASNGIKDHQFKKNDDKHFRAIYPLKRFNTIILKASPKEVDAKCGALISNWDDGTPILKDMGSFAGCYIGLPGPGMRHMIIIRWDEQGAKALIHELHHAAGFPRDAVDLIDWDAPRAEDGV